MISCPQCDAGIDVDEDELDEGDALLCEDCGSELIVTAVSPLELSPGAEDDLDDDEDEDDLDEEDDEDEDEDDTDYDYDGDDDDDLVVEEDDDD